MFSFDIMSGGGAETEGDAEPEAGSRPWAVSTEPNVGLELQNHKVEVMTWAKVRHLIDWATQVPLHELFFNNKVER